MNLIKKFYILYKLKTRKKIIFTEKEKNIVSMVRKLCSNKNTIIDNSKFGYLLENDNSHIKCLITGNTVFVTNTIKTTECIYSEAIIKKLNSFCENRISNDCERKIQEMFGKENEMLNSIIQSI